MINGPRRSRIDWNSTEIEASKVGKPRKTPGFPGHRPLWTVKTRDDAYDGEPALGFGGRVYAATLHDDDTLTCYGAETAPAAPSTRASKKAPAGWTTGQMFAWFAPGSTDFTSI